MYIRVVLSCERSPQWNGHGDDDDDGRRARISFLDGSGQRRVHATLMEEPAKRSQRAHRQDR